MTPLELLVDWNCWLILWTGPMIGDYGQRLRSIVVHSSEVRVRMHADLERPCAIVSWFIASFTCFDDSSWD